MTDTANLEACDGYWRGSFKAMASPCELLIETSSQTKAQMLIDLAYAEVMRIEQKFSRYRDDNIIHLINHSQGQAIKVDDETAVLLDYAAQCFDFSEGQFDITSGVLREIWHFDGSDKIPSKKAVENLLPRIGWNKTIWQKPYFTLLDGMEIDLGGIGKEYAVDRTALLLKEKTAASILINYGGDIYVTDQKKDGSGWLIGVEDPDGDDPEKETSIKEYELSKGGLATSGDARRFLLKDSVRYSHILNPKTGWSVSNAPRSITVATDTCTEAGILSTFAMLHGNNAEAFLREQGVTFWCVR